MTRRCVIERWVQRKTDQKLIFHGNYTQIVLFVFRIHFHYVLSYLFGLFRVRTCVSILWHTSLPKNATSLEKIAKNHDFGNFWWFLCFWHDVTYDVTVASYKVCLYPLVPYLPTVPFFPGLSRFLFPKNTEKRDCPVFHFSQEKKKRKEKNNKNNKQ